MTGLIQNVLVRALVLAVALAGAASSAIADPIPGASYRGVASDYAIVTFTVAADGSSLTSYSITNVHGNTCSFSGDGVAGSWDGAPIVNGAFDYQIGASMTFQGTFPGAQSASGSFQFHNNAVAGAAPACDTGTVNWTATTTANPPSGGGGGSGSGSGGSGSGGSGSGGNGSGGNGSGGSGSGANGGTSQKTKVPTRVVFGKLSRTQLGGRIRSASKDCLASRTLILWRGGRRIASTRSKVNGTYSFRRSANVRGRKVHVQVTPLTNASTICEAATSGTVKA